MAVLVGLGIEVALFGLLIVGGLAFEVAGRLRRGRLGLGRARCDRARSGAGRDLRKSDARGGGERETHERADQGTTGHLLNRLRTLESLRQWGVAAYE